MVFWFSKHVVLTFDMFVSEFYILFLQYTNIFLVIYRLIFKLGVSKNDEVIRIRDYVDINMF